MGILRTKISSLDVLILCLQVAGLTFVPHKLYVLFKYISLMYLLIKYIPGMWKKKTLFVLLVGYTIILTLSTFINTYSITWTLSAFMEGIQLIVLFLVSEGVSRNIGFKNYVRCLLRIFLGVLLINDLLFLLIPYEFWNPNEIYLVGNKFRVSYLHLLCSCLCWLLASNRVHKIIALGAVVFSGIIAKTVTCSTGIIMVIVVMALMLLPKQIWRILTSPLTLLLIIAAENFLIWGPVNIFSNPTIQFIIVDIFHKTPNMTGRSKLYDAVMPLIKEKLLLGYGHNTDIFHRMFGYGNAQNGLFHIIIQAGILGAVVYFAAVYFAAKGNGNFNLYKGIYMYLLAMIVASAIETSLSLLFMMGVAILYACNMSHTNSVKKQNIKFTFGKNRISLL